MAVTAAAVNMHVNMGAFGVVPRALSVDSNQALGAVWTAIFI